MDLNKESCKLLAGCNGMILIIWSEVRSIWWLFIPSTEKALAHMRTSVSAWEERNPPAQSFHTNGNVAVPLSLFKSVFLKTADLCCGHLVIPGTHKSLSAQYSEEKKYTHTQKSINVRLALVLADLIFWVNRAMQTQLSVRSRHNEQSLIPPVYTTQ